MAFPLGTVSQDLVLDHPTPSELHRICESTHAEWGDALNLETYLKESAFLATIPLAKDGGLTNWILTTSTEPTHKRPILASCESFRKMALISDGEGRVIEGAVHGIASVFCAPQLRGRGYPQRMLRELAELFPRWQDGSAEKMCIGSILYSDIGKSYYAKLGWHPNCSNSHHVFPPSNNSKPTLTQMIPTEDLPGLCERDEAMVRKHMAAPAPDVKVRMTILPDINHMLWHIAKADFATQYLFGKTPPAKGAIAGDTPGKQVWAIWTQRYYEHPNSNTAANVLYILRLVIEADPTATRLPSDSGKVPNGSDYEEQKRLLVAVLQAGQAEAAEWKLDAVKLWDPSPLVKKMISESEMECETVERESESIASGLWYDGNGNVGADTPLWTNNEHYAWC